jgi:hypothetical protein
MMGEQQWTEMSHKGHFFLEQPEGDNYQERFLKGPQAEEGREEVCAMSLARACFCSFRVGMRGFHDMLMSHPACSCGWDGAYLYHFPGSPAHVSGFIWSDYWFSAAGCDGLGFTLCSEMADFQDGRDGFASGSFLRLSHLNAQSVQCKLSHTCIVFSMWWQDYRRRNESLETVTCKF